MKRFKEAEKKNRFLEFQKALGGGQELFHMQRSNERVEKEENPVL